MAALIDTDATGVMTTDLTADSASSGLNVSRAVSWRHRVLPLLADYGALIGLIVLTVTFSVTTPFFLTTENFANIGRFAAIGGIFIITLIVVSIITVKISDMILDSRIGALDRTLGFFFGAARGFLICVIGWVFLNWLLQGKNPEWATASRTRPALESTGSSLVAMLPDNPEGLLQQLRNKSQPEGGEPAEVDIVHELGVLDPATGTGRCEAVQRHPVGCVADRVHGERDAVPGGPADGAGQFHRVLGEQAERLRPRVVVRAVGGAGVQRSVDQHLARAGGDQARRAVDRLPGAPTLLDRPVQ